MRSTRSGWSRLLPNTSFDYARSVGDGRGSSIVMACMNWICRVFPEAPASVQQFDASGTARFLPGHPFQQLIERPNPYYSGIALMMATMLDLYLDGNAYWRYRRSATGKVVELWYTPAFMLEPKWPDDGSAYISHYEYQPFGDRKPERVEIADIQHFRYGLDADNTRKGMSQLKAIIREIFTDDEAANFTASLLRNLGIPGVIIAPGDPDGEASADDVEEVKQSWMRRFGGDKRGEPLVMKTKTDVKVLSFSPTEMDLKTLRRLPEERISAAFGLPAIVVGLGAGLDRSTFANFAEAREAAYESNISPIQRLMAADLTNGLLREFTDDPRVRVVFDTRNVRILQEDINKRSKRMTEEFNGGIITRYEARAEVGKPVTEADKVYRIQTNQIEFLASGNAVKHTDDILGASAFGSSPAPKKPAPAKKDDDDE